MGVWECVIVGVYRYMVKERYSLFHTYRERVRGIQGEAERQS